MKAQDASDDESSSDETSVEAGGRRHCLFRTPRSWRSFRLCASLLTLVCIFTTASALAMTRGHGDRQVVLHFLFLAIDDVPHGHHWRRFFDGAPAGSWTVWLHCADRPQCLHSSFLRQVPEARLVPSVPILPCRDTVTAHVQLLRYALRETEVDAEKFVLVSDGMLPIKPFSQVLARLTAHSGSDFCVYPTEQWHLRHPPMYLVQHLPAVQLNRADAKTFVTSWDLSGGLFVKSVDVNLTTDGRTWEVRKYPAWKIPVLGRNRSVGIEDFVPDRSFCSDEVAAFSSIHGAMGFGKDYPSNSTSVDGFGTVRLQDLKGSDCRVYGLCSGRMQGRCFTYFSFADWSLDDYTLEGDLADDDESVVYPTSSKRPQQPVAFGNLSKRALRRLRTSPWLFAGEFRADAKLPDYKEEILKPEAEREVQEFDPQGPGCLRRATRAPGTGSSGPAAVLHFLFLAIDTVFHAALWEQFFAGAPRGAWRAWLHCKEPEACRKSGFYLRIPGVTLVSRVRTIYCNDLLSAAVHMVRRVLAATAGSMLQKFVLMSDSTLPLKPFPAVFATLTQDSASDFCFYPAREWLRADMNGEDIFALQHHQWWVLNGADAIELACRWAPRFDVTNWPHWDVPLHGRSQALAQKGELDIAEFDDGKPSWACTDEVAPFGLLYGAFAPGSTGAQRYAGFGEVTSSGQAASENQGRCRTMVLWNASSHEELKRELVADSGTTVIGPTWGAEGGSDPAAFSRFSDDALRALRASEYLFIRKVVRDASLENYGRIVLSQ